MNDKTFRTLSAIYLATLAVAVISLFAVFYLHYQNIQLKADIVFVVKDLKNRQQQIADLNASNNKLEDDLFWYKTANDVLIEHCEPKTLSKAIKATPLPPLVIL